MIRWQVFQASDGAANMAPRVEVAAQAVLCELSLHDHGPGPPRALSGLSVSHRKLGCYGAFVWALWALNSRKRRLPARADTPATPSWGVAFAGADAYGPSRPGGKVYPRGPYIVRSVAFPRAAPTATPGLGTRRVLTQRWPGGPPGPLGLSIP